MVTHEPVDPELLAALLDGRLEGEERQAAIAHIMRSPEAFEAFAEAMRIQRDLEAEAGADLPVLVDGETTAEADSDFQAANEAGSGAEVGSGPAPASGPPGVSIFPPVSSEGGPSPVLPPDSSRGATSPVPPSMREARPPRRFRPVTAGLALAAVLAGVLLIPTLLRDRGGDLGPLALLDGATLVSAPGNGSLDQALPPNWDQPDGLPITRGDGSEETNGPPERDPPAEFQAGVRAAQVRIALEARDSAALGRAQARLDSVLVRLDVAAGTRDEFRQLGPMSSRADRARAADRLFELFREMPWFDLGIWTEQARLATLAGRTGFFDSTAAQTLRVITASVAAEQGRDDALAVELRELEEQIHDGISSRDELTQVETKLNEVVRRSSR